MTNTSTNTSTSTSADVDYLLSMREVCALTGRSRHTIYRMVKAGLFPAPAKISKRSIGWRTSAINKWLDDLSGRIVKY